MNMRIAHVFFSYPNKYQPYNQQLVKRMKASGFECDTFSFAGIGSLKEGCIEAQSRLRKIKYVLKALTMPRQTMLFSRAFNYSWWRAALVYGRFSYITKHQPAVIHVHHIQVISDEFLNFLDFMHTAWVVSLRGYEVAIRPLLSKKDYQVIQKRLLKAHGVHAVAQDLKRRALEMGVPDERVHVIRRTIEIEAPVSSKVEYNGELFLTTIGRFNWKKGLVFLLQSVAILKQRKINVCLNICGNGNINEEAEIRYWIALLKISDQVILHGFLASQEIDKILEHTHVYVQPSINEGIPNTLVRVMASHIPVVASAVDGIPEVLEDNVNGILVPPGNPLAIADAIMRVLSESELRDRIKHSSLKNISLDAAREMRDYELFYSFALKKG